MNSEKFITKKFDVKSIENLYLHSFFKPILKANEVFPHLVTVQVIIVPKRSNTSSMKDTQSLGLVLYKYH